MIQRWSCLFSMVFIPQQDSWIHWYVTRQLYLHPSPCETNNSQIFNNEECLNLKELENRNWPGDRLIKMLSIAGCHIESIQLGKTFWKGLEAQLGSKMPEYLISPFGKTKILRPTDD